MKACIGYQSEGIRQQAIDHFKNDEAEIEGGGDSKGREILSCMHVVVPAVMIMVIPVMSYPPLTS